MRTTFAAAVAAMIGIFMFALGLPKPNWYFVIGSIPVGLLAAWVIYDWRDFRASVRSAWRETTSPAGIGIAESAVWTFLSLLSCLSSIALAAIGLLACFGRELSGAEYVLVALCCALLMAVTITPGSVKTDVAARKEMPLEAAELHRLHAIADAKWQVMHLNPVMIWFTAAPYVFLGLWWLVTTGLPASGNWFRRFTVSCYRKTVSDGRIASVMGACVGMGMGLFVGIFMRSLEQPFLALLVLSVGGFFGGLAGYQLHLGHRASLRTPS